VLAVLALEIVACPLCGGKSATPLFEQRDLALGVPGRFPLARCEGCGLLYQNPRVRADQLGLVYPEQYDPHVREPDLSRTVRLLGAGGRRLLARRLGYHHLDPGPVPRAERLRAALAGRRLVKAFPPWAGGGRLLDVGCASGKFLRQMAAVGWHCSGIEQDADAAARARHVTPDVFTGEPMDAPFPPASFDLVTAFHVLEHLPDPLGVLRRMLAWLAPGGSVVLEVPNVAGLGSRLFGRYWCGLDLPRHLVQFTPATLAALAERAGGRVVATTHRTKPRYVLRSLRHLLADRDGRGARLARALVESGPGAGVIKAALEVAMPLARPLRLGEAVRCVIQPAR
jgi:2-polyprenyl-3-methyl-5-hydroxy-6-metoxy-1,4-benzoquinol methylase